MFAELPRTHAPLLPGWFVLALLVFSLTISQPAGPGLAEPAEPAKVPSVERFLAGGSRIDLERIRKSDYEGALDLAGLHATIDPQTQELVFAPESATAAQHEDDIFWLDGFGPRKIQGLVFAIAIYDGEVIIGGKFVTAGDKTVNRIARWDGNTWQPLGSGFTASESPGVFALTVYQGNLIAGGDFTHTGATEVNAIASWNGTSWSALGSGFLHVSNPFATIFALGEYDGKLIAGGRFEESGGTPMENIAQWNGSSWSALDSGLNGRVVALTVYGGNLIAGGGFTNIGPGTFSRIAQWNGSSWSALAGGMNGGVTALVVHAGGLFAGGTFSMAGGNAASRIARWDGASWSALGSGVNDEVNALLSYGTDLIVGGRFTDAGGLPVTRIARWDGSWHPMGILTNLNVQALGMHDGRPITYLRGACPSLCDFTMICWDDGLGSGWYTMGGGATDNTVEPRVSAFGVFTSSLMVGGEFDHIGCMPANNVAGRIGDVWFPLSSGTNGRVRALATYKNSLYAGGDFTLAGGTSVDYIARWDGGSWHNVAGGTDGPVWSLQVYNNELIVGGEFFHVGPGTSANQLARWNGTSWSAFPSELSHSTVAPKVFGMLVHGGDLVVAGTFQFAGAGQANNIARWDGSNWHAYGSGMNETVVSLAEYFGKLIAGGRFSTAGGVTANRIAGWDGSAWASLGTLEEEVSALTVYSNVLYAGGTFVAADTSIVNYIARWSGTEWIKLGSGTDDPVEALFVYGPQLYVGGSFTMAGGKRAQALARWNKTALGVGVRGGVEPIVNLAPNIPNPFATQTVFSFGLAAETNVRLDIYDARGRRVATLLDGTLTAGEHRVEWNGRSENGERASPGVYWARLGSNGSSITRKVVLLRGASGY
jgi:hypothetical protein